MSVAALQACNWDARVPPVASWDARQAPSERAASTVTVGTPVRLLKCQRVHLRNQVVLNLCRRCRLLALFA